MVVCPLRQERRRQRGGKRAEGWTALEKEEWWGGGEGEKERGECVLYDAVGGST